MIQFVNCLPDAVVQGDEYFRVSITPGLFAAPDYAFSFWEALAALGYAIPTSAAPPQDTSAFVKSFVSVEDFRLNGPPSMTFADLANTLNGLLWTCSITRLELIPPSSSNDAAQIDAQRKQDQTAADSADFLTKLEHALGSAGKWVLIAAVLILALTLLPRFIGR